MRPDKPHKPWLQVWRDWLDALPLRDEPTEPELPAASFGAAEPAKAATRSDQPTSDPQESQSTADARPPAP